MTRSSAVESARRTRVRAGSFTDSGCALLTACVRARASVVIVLAVLLVGVGCGGEPALDADRAQDDVAVSSEGLVGSPVAVIKGDGTGGEDAGIGTGTLALSQDCLVLDDDARGPVLLVFEDEAISWDPDSLVLEFTSPFDGQPVEVAVGDRVTVGGGDGVGSGATWINQPSCAKVDHSAGVSSLEIPNS